MFRLLISLFLLIAVAYAFGALWFDFPVAVMRRPLAVVLGLCAIVALVFVRPHWRALFVVVGAIVLIAAWDFHHPPFLIRATGRPK